MMAPACSILQQTGERRLQSDYAAEFREDLRRRGLTYDHIPKDPHYAILDLASGKLRAPRNPGTITEIVKQARRHVRPGVYDEYVALMWLAANRRRLQLSGPVWWYREPAFRGTPEKWITLREWLQAVGYFVLD